MLNRSRHHLPSPRGKGQCHGPRVSFLLHKGGNVRPKSKTTAALRRLSDTELKIADPAEDIRDRKVVDRDGEELGEVNDLLIDEHDRRVRFFQGASGGFLGLGQTKFLLPVDAITRISEDTVYVNQTR